MSCREHRGAPGLLGIVIAACLFSACGASRRAPPAVPSTTTSVGPPARVGQCLPRGAHVIATSHDAVVYTVPHTVHAVAGQGPARPGVAIYGCLAGSRGRSALGTATRVEGVALNHTALAYATTEVRGIDTISTHVVVVDVRHGHRLFDVPAGHIAIAPHFISVDMIAVAPSGTVAWIQHGGTLESSGYSVHTASVAKPADHQLASGAINPRSLTLTPTTVSWVEGGQRRSASI